MVKESLCRTCRHAAEMHVGVNGPASLGRYQAAATCIVEGCDCQMLVVPTPPPTDSERQSSAQLLNAIAEEIRSQATFAVQGAIDAVQMAIRADDPAWVRSAVGRLAEKVPPEFKNRLSIASLDYLKAWSKS